MRLKKIALLSLSCLMASYMSAYSISNATEPADTSIQTKVTVANGMGSYKTTEYNKFLDPINPTGEKDYIQNLYKSAQKAYPSVFPQPTTAAPLAPVATMSFPALSGGFYNPLPSHTSAGNLDAAAGSSLNVAQGDYTSEASVNAVGSGAPSLNYSIGAGGVVGSISTGMAADIVEGDNSTVEHYQHYTSASGIVTFGQSMSYTSKSS
jgi:hypothetical protein